MTKVKAAVALSVAAFCSFILYTSYAFSVAVNSHPFGRGAHYTTGSKIYLSIVALIGLSALIYILKIVVRRQ